LAVITFWGLAWRGYWLGAESFLPFLSFDENALVADWRAAVQSKSWQRLLPGLVPTALIVLAARVSPRTRLRWTWAILASVVCTVTLCWSARRGLSYHFYNASLVSEVKLRDVRWDSLLGPIILTTLFVILGAWQSRGRVEVPELSKAGSGDHDRAGVETIQS